MLLSAAATLSLALTFASWAPERAFAQLTFKIAVSAKDKYYIRGLVLASTNGTDYYPICNRDKTLIANSALYKLGYPESCETVACSLFELLEAQARGRFISSSPESIQSVDGCAMPVNAWCVEGEMK